MDKYLQYMAMCDKNPQFLHAKDLQRIIAEKLLELKKGRVQETVTARKGLLGFIGMKTKKQAVYNPAGYLRSCAIVANQCSAMIPYTGLYIACESGDYFPLQQAFYQFARMRVLSSYVLDGGEDHSTLFPSVIWGLAAADRNLLETLFPQEAGISTTEHPLNVICTNLLMGLWYRNNTQLKAGKEKVAEWLESKHAMTNSGTVRYLLSLAEKDTTQAAEALQEICKGIPHEKDLYVRSSDKQFDEYMVPFLHGLYNLAVFVAGWEFYTRLPMPKQYIWMPYTEYLAEQEYPAPATKPYFTFSGEAQMINLMLDKIPTAKIVSDAKNQFIDTKAMTGGLLSKLSTNINVEDFFRQYN